MIRVRLEGKEFGKLTVIRQLLKRDKHRKIRWRCKCSCGNIITTTSNCLLKGNTKSCGHNKKEICKLINFKHGFTKTKEYRCWRNIKNKCLNKNTHDYKYYGKRGIKIYNKWLNSFDNFLKDMGNCPKGYTIERKDNDGNYEPGNCKWATRADQNRNTRRTVIIVYLDKTMCKIDWVNYLNTNKQWFDRKLKKYNGNMGLIIRDLVISRSCYNG